MLFLSAYNMEAYDRPSLATDVAVFSLFEEDSSNHRKTASLVEETEEFTEGAGHRPARLFRKKR